MAAEPGVFHKKRLGHLAKPFYVNMERTPAESKFRRKIGSYLGTTLVACGPF